VEPFAFEVLLDDGYDEAVGSVAAVSMMGVAGLAATLK
jgi:hypothetical protein